MSGREACAPDAQALAVARRDRSEAREVSPRRQLGRKRDAAGRATTDRRRAGDRPASSAGARGATNGHRSAAAAAALIQIMRHTAFIVSAT
ncbi:hypothetical protein [Burkholderia pseudomallei]|uniref:hypothetical protein n=1 Tax=Burkholderia pseudomallei TaxID=28450 RepID=UPI0002EBAA11|nr:hypothetical protein [Burkholderia pseudomallei]AYX36457.1 hypothetical protein EGY15_16095 [Burkholderia pseudomallei]OMR34042.1 hypothetical protein AQ722_28270 [Burkholderia pseudomallei]OMS12682.1 hypothetical protein AQ736_28935 [Burkholderia pseudomallei]OMT09139.1 hypothetical protein AQ750_14580 [Burkholderia pseudomallei]OMT47880.1 hypothetical protein AQ759_06795 [Burkholderia pseudomallei]